MTEPIPHMIAMAKKHENARYEDPEANSINDRSGFLLANRNAPRTAIQQITAVSRRAGKIIHTPIIKKGNPEEGSKYKATPKQTPIAEVQINACR